MLKIRGFYEIRKNERLDDLEYKNIKIIQNKDYFVFGIDSISF